MHQARMLRTLDSQTAARFARGLCIELGIMKSLFLTALLFCVAVAPAFAEEWPQRFVLTKGTEHTLVVLNQDGSAAYSTRKLRPGSTEYFFSATHASWRWCDLEVPRKDQKRCLLLDVEGYDGHKVEFQFDYLYDSSTLTQIDKMGVQEVLKRVLGY